MRDHVKAPFTEDQVASLQGFQNCGYMHQCTCECGADMIPTKEGWVCGSCAYTQDWCHAFMADWRWKKLGDAIAQMRNG
jgi:hypothetical protein